MRCGDNDSDMAFFMFLKMFYKINFKKSVFRKRLPSEMKTWEKKWWGDFTTAPGTVGAYNIIPTLGKRGPLFVPLLAHQSNIR